MKVKTRAKPKADTHASDTKKGKAPDDADAKERKGYYGYLENKYNERTETKDEEGRRVIWTDGSAVENEAGVMKAGAGAFLGIGNKRNREIVVEGPQTNQRAELTAALHCIETEEGPIHIRTDSKYVQLGVEIWRHQWRSKAWFKKPQMALEIDHADLWQRLDNMLARRPKGEVKISWVKGHALPRHIRWEMTTEQDIWGNNWADTLAGRASALAAVG
eukprot:gene57470-biopygen47187